MPTLSEVFLTFGRQYMARFAHAMLPAHIKALWDIATCRTGAKGGRLLRCDKCGHMEYVYHSCCNRSCPQCHVAKSQTWLEKRKQELLEVPYFHLVFTLPAQLGPIVRSNQRVMYTILFKAAVYALNKLTADKRYLGGQIGILAVLHTWGRALGYHLHLHCLVPAVGPSKDKQQIYIYLARHNYLVPVKALSKIFRAKFLQLAREELPQLQKVFDDKWLINTPKKWVVYSKPTLSHTEKVLEYLARYLHRTAITNRRIVEINPHEETVTFKYKICPICMTGYMVEVRRLDAQSIPYKQTPPPWPWLTHHAKTISLG